ncbi:MAG: GNAT family N-acetyltransferase [Parasphingopyxis sp.]|uniref:GNAT family N-acetyltransferase n=1 Tax=Parasphingopyxis sp. TaxID=1920299 RepID=UPI0032ED190B
MAGSHQIFRTLERATLDAGAALSRVSQPWMFDRADWFELAAKHTPEGKPLIIKARDGGSACWLFLNQNDHSAHALSNWYCLRYGIVTEGPEPPYGQLVDGLRAAGVSHIRLAPTAMEDGFVSALHRRGWLTKREPINVSWRIDTSEMSFDEYWAARPSRLRNTAKRKAKSAKLDFAIGQSIDATNWAHVCEVFENSWKKPDGTPALTYDLFNRAAEARTLRIGLAFHEGQAVAAQLWTIEGGVAIIHLLSYREDAKKLGAGTVLSYQMFKHAIDEEGVRLIDFGLGDHAYKREWMEYCVPLYCLTAYHIFSFSGLISIVKMVGRKLSNLRSRA